MPECKGRLVEQFSEHARDKCSEIENLSLAQFRAEERLRGLYVEAIVAFEHGGGGCMPEGHSASAQEFGREHTRQAQFVGRCVERGGPRNERS